MIASYRQKEEFTWVKPTQPELESVISHYYFHRTYHPEFERRFTYYPNYRVAWNVFEHSQVGWHDQVRFTLPSKQHKITSILTHSTSRSREVQMKGRINKLGIVFEPLGWNHFFDGGLGDIMDGTISFFREFGEGAQSVFQDVFGYEDLASKRNALDQYFMAQLRSFEIVDLSIAVEAIMASFHDVRIGDLAKRLGLSRKTLLRLFRKHLNCSVKEFISLVRFRTSLELCQGYKGHMTLTEIAHRSGYYDQSAFIKHFKSVTGTNPKQVLHSVQDLGEGNILWSYPN